MQIIEAGNWHRHLSGFEFIDDGEYYIGRVLIGGMENHIDSVARS